MAAPIYNASSLRDDEISGRVLFQNFIHEELAHEGLPEDVIEVENEGVQNQAAFLGGPDGFNNQYLRRIGRNIRDIADQFNASPERNLIREQAEDANLGSITETSFNHMLEELFENGIDSSRIIALFTFCSDVLIRCVKNALFELGKKLFIWALNFLVTKVCKWVNEHGGWGRVFSNVYNFTMKASAVVALGVVIISGIIYIMNNLYFHGSL